MRRCPCDFTVTRLSSPAAGRATAWPASLPFSSRLWLTKGEKGEEASPHLLSDDTITLQFRRAEFVSVREITEFLQNFKYDFALKLKSSFVFLCLCLCFFFLLLLGFFCLNSATSVSFIRSLPLSLKVY